MYKSGPTRNCLRQKVRNFFKLILDIENDIARSGVAILNHLTVKIVEIFPRRNSHAYPNAQEQYFLTRSCSSVRNTPVPGIRTLICRDKWATSAAIWRFFHLRGFLSTGFPIQPIRNIYRRPSISSSVSKYSQRSSLPRLCARSVSTFMNGKKLHMEGTCTIRVMSVSRGAWSRLRVDNVTNTNGLNPSRLLDPIQSPVLRT